jgi:hypothetical protein
MRVHSKNPLTCTRSSGGQISLFGTSILLSLGRVIGIIHVFFTKRDSQMICAALSDEGHAVITTTALEEELAY